jgi:hypothetical protein
VRLKMRTFFEFLKLHENENEALQLLQQLSKEVQLLIKKVSAGNGISRFFEPLKKISAEAERSRLFDTTGLNNLLKNWYVSDPEVTQVNIEFGKKVDAAIASIQQPHPGGSQISAFGNDEEE